MQYRIQIQALTLYTYTSLYSYTEPTCSQTMLQTPNVPTHTLTKWLFGTAQKETDTVRMWKTVLDS